MAINDFLGGLFGSGDGLGTIKSTPMVNLNKPEVSWMDVLATLGASLQDASAGMQGRTGGNVNALQTKMKRLGDQKQYQDTVGALIGKPMDNLNVMSTPDVFSGDIAGRQAAQANNAQSMMFSGPLGQSLPFEQAASFLPMLQNLDPQQGLPLMAQLAMGAQERKDRRGDAALQRSEARFDADQAYNRTREAQITDKQMRDLSPEEMQAKGLRGRWQVDAFGGLHEAQAPDTLSPEAERQRMRIAAAGRAPTQGPQPPSGYQWTQGGLTFIPGGPADPAVAGRGTGKPTEDQAKNAQLYTLSKQMLPQVLKNFDQLGTAGNSLGGMFGNSPLTTSPEYQQADNGINSIVANWLYSTSGATATPDEVAKRAATVKPRYGDSTETRELKKKALTDMVESIAMRASPQLLSQQPSNAAPAQGAPQGAPVQIKSGAEYDRLPPGSVYIGPDGQQRRKR